ncbi:hypothetical protein DMUE_2192 [Dictyocoela muelleri]|nr:hypothetical protein DMUE_2192 [Dictyocoela muelleri]
MVFQIILFYVASIPRFGMINYINLGRSTILRILNKIVDRIPDPDFSSNKFGGDGKIVQVDETILKYKIKSHRVRALTNRTDALCIVMFENEIKRVFACIIPYKREMIIIPIIFSQVASNTTIWTDEHRAYSNLKEFDYTHEQSVTNMSL